MYKYAILDPRPIPAAKEANNKVFAESLGVMGIEVTIHELAGMCLLGNVDPQHGTHSETYNNGGYMESTPSTVKKDETAIEFVARQPIPKKGCWVGNMIPTDGATLATIRPDVDSVGAMAIFSLLSEGVDLAPATTRINLIATSDKFARGGWQGVKALPTRNNPWDEGLATAESSRPLAAIAAAVADFKVPLADRVSTMKQWLLTGEEPEQYRVQVEKERLDMIAALESGAIKYETRAGEKIAVVESTHRAATSVGYSLAPVVVALNPSFKQGPGEPYKKFTICAFEAKFADIKSVLAELATTEAGWGGSPTIGGSPQGVSSTLTIDQVVTVVKRHLL